MHFLYRSYLHIRNKGNRWRLAVTFSFLCSNNLVTVIFDTGNRLFFLSKGSFLTSTTPRTKEKTGEKPPIMIAVSIYVTANRVTVSRDSIIIRSEMIENQFQVPR